jgi:hypothetical protein
MEYSERLALCVAVDDLDAVLLPFAPHERANGRPGVWIDAVRARYLAPRRKNRSLRTICIRAGA